MLKNIVRGIRKTLGAVESHPVAAELKTRQKLAFCVRDLQVEVGKRSPAAQIVVGTIVGAAIRTGNRGAADMLSGPHPRPLSRTRSTGRGDIVGRVPAAPVQRGKLSAA